ncbi:N-acetylglucosamine-6-phosphate deacetylase [Paenibacillus psychroresistens]|uniref:N-acetylglucosamine-6-phosphate deacetylase n=1 Tax=Paenibacillus psychroresistens TaxID=1778678 RepID=A0A6B8RIN3_9BACL|nr:N-acetylglucosamine-6-phosphate deacetylase [Paenibacillus psychroresistens]QGQ95208.1 N-acetylglucosamine-6-phosphate deacetylase [Paenibacillus psychroresistens]
MTRASSVYINGTFYTETGIVENGRMQVNADGKIEAIGSAREVSLPQSPEYIVDLAGHKVIPGMIDVHVHGGNGFDVMKPTYANLDGMSRFHAEHGTTSFLATTGAGTKEQVFTALNNIYEAYSAGLTGAELLGVHLEGPYLSPKRKGAFMTEHLRVPDLAEMQAYLDVSGNIIKLVTLAPEIKSGFELAAYLLNRGIQVSIGHSDATYDEVAKAVELGCLHSTHHFNGMRPFHHREPGVAGAGLIIPEFVVELIADGIHVHPAGVRLLFAVKTPQNVCVVTDAVAYAGLPDGIYEESTVMDGIIHLTGTDTLAGSSLTMIQALRNVITFTGLPLETILPSFTIVPARKSGVEQRKGSLAVGKDADFILLDDELHIHDTYIKGLSINA